MTPESKSRAGRPSDAEARAIIDHARRLRAETLARLVRAASLRIAGRPAAVMPHARA